MAAANCRRRPHGAQSLQAGALDVQLVGWNPRLEAPPCAGCYAFIIVLAMLRGGLERRRVAAPAGGSSTCRRLNTVNRVELLTNVCH